MDDEVYVGFHGDTTEPVRDRFQIGIVLQYELGMIFIRRRMFLSQCFQTNSDNAGVGAGNLLPRV